MNLVDCRAMKAMPDQLILKRDPNARYTESYNVPFLESEVRSEVPRCGKRG